MLKFANDELIERGPQLGRLDTVLAACVDGPGRAAVITGPVASGKTALLNRFLDRAAEGGALVLSAVASRAEQQLQLGVIDQLVHSGRLPEADTATITGLLDELAETCWMDTASSGVQERTKAEALRRLCRALLELCERDPLVISVDDVQYVDLPSQHCLASLIRRLRGNRMLIVLTEGTGPVNPSMPLQNELRSDAMARIQVDLLSRRAVGQLVADVLGLAGPGPADAAYALTGGNPLLLGALLGDSRAAGGDRVAPGDEFAQAVRSFLGRSGPIGRRVAQALAVVGECAGAATLGRLLDLTTEEVDRTTELFDRGGLLAGGRLHPTTRTAVIRDMEPAQQAGLHAQAAELMQVGGQPASVVSRHLVQAGRTTRWALPVLIEAAEQALADGDVGHALTCLDAAAVGGADDRTRADVLAMTARIKWRVNPCDALPYLPGTIAAVQDRTLVGCLAAVPVQHLLWFGRPEQAVELLDELVRESMHPDLAPDLAAAVLLLAATYPDLRERAKGYWKVLSDAGAPMVEESPAGLAVRALLTLCAGGCAEEITTAAEKVLAQVRLGDDTLIPARVALWTLRAVGSLDVAAAWCASMQADTGVAAAPAWQAVLLAHRAALALEWGDLRAAEDDALTALDLITPAGWGVAVGEVLATLVLATTHAGRFDVAAQYLNHPLSPEMLRTPAGLRYVHARGVHHLAVGRVRAAVIDFRVCEDVMTRLDLDFPWLVPWRSWLAQAHLANGRVSAARELAAEALELIGDKQPRLRAMTLRVLAAASEVKQRPALLREAIDLAQRAGGWLEAARAFADLGGVLVELGEPNRARLALRTARHIAKHCQSGELLRSLNAEGAPTPVEASASAESPAVQLSEAERRVVALAALGHTNREIAGTLYVTVSTVEQHLTRVYRKLGVTGRSDLPPGLKVNGVAIGL